MSKFCGNCGAVADDNAMVCGSCGTPFAPVQPNYQPPVQPGYNPMPGAPVMNQNIPGVTNIGVKKNSVLPKVIAAVLAVVILVVGVVAIIGNKSKSDYETVISDYETVIKEYAHAIETGNGTKIANRLHKDTYLDKEDIMDFFEEANEDLCEQLDSSKIKTSYKITDTEDVSKSDMEYEVGIEKEGIIVWFDLTVEGNGDKETYRSGIAFVKDGGWKIADLGIKY